MADLTEFIVDHRSHWKPHRESYEPTWNGYLLTVPCGCGVVFERWVTPWNAELDVLRIAGLN